MMETDFFVFRLSISDELFKTWVHLDLKTPTWDFTTS